MDLIVICSHGRTGLKRWALGSIAQGLVHQSPVPLLVLRDGGQVTSISTGATHGSICALVALDGSPFAETALLPAAHLVAQLSAPGEGKLDLVHVITHVGEEALQNAKKYIVGVTEQLQQRLNDENLSISWSLLRDKDIAGAVVDLAQYGNSKTTTDQAYRSDLIAMSTHGRGGLERMMMGSVTERVLHGTKLPMLILPCIQMRKMPQHLSSYERSVSECF